MIQISPLEDITSLNKPRRVMTFVLIYCTSGELTLTIDESDFKLSADDVTTITSGQFHYIKENKTATGYVLEFTLDFFCKDDKDIELIFHNGLFCHFAQNEIIHLGDNSIVNQLQCIRDELQRQPYQYLISTRSRIQLMLVEINRIKVGRGDEVWKPDALFLKFLEAVRSNFEHNYSVTEFSSMLGTTDLKLNEQSKIHAGKTAQNVIYGLITSEAKRLLTYENLSVKEVAFRLGFKDPFYFSNFFKKHANASPKAYQETHSV